MCIVGSISNCFHANDSKDWTAVFVAPYKEIHLVQVSYTAAVMNINISSSSKIFDAQNKFFITHGQKNYDQSNPLVLA